MATRKGSNYMRALRRGKDGQAVLTQVPIPEPAENEVLVRVLRAGICNTDLEILKGYMSYEGTLGHEFVGEIVKFGVNAASPLDLGDRVVGDINACCNRCNICAEGGVIKRNHCCQRTVLGILGRDGSFAEYLVLPSINLHRVPDNVPLRSVVFAEPLAAAFRIIEQNLIKATDKVAVIGDGKLGLLITQALYSRPHKEMVIFGHHQNKMDLLPVQGITKILSKSLENTKSYKDYFDVVVEVSGSPDGLMLAADLTKPLGTIVLKSTCAAASSGFNTAVFVVKELSIIGSRCGDLEMALSALEQGKIDVEVLITQEYPFHDALEAMKHAGQRGTLKIQLIMDNK